MPPAQDSANALNPGRESEGHLKERCLLIEMAVRESKEGPGESRTSANNLHRHHIETTH